MSRRTTAPGSDIRASRSNRVLIGQRIARRRTELGLSQTELAVKFGVSRASISQYELGTGDLNAGDMTFLAEVLDVPVTYFFLDDYKVDSRTLLDAIISYVVRLPLNYQQHILNTTRATFLDLRGRDVREGDEIEEIGKPGDGIEQLESLKELLRKLPWTT